MQSYEVSFNDNRINEVPGVWLYNYNATDLPTRDINLHKLARRSLSIITSSEYSQKSIPVMMKVCSGNRQETEATLTQVKGLLQPQNGSLEVIQSGILVRYTATMNEFNIEWDGSNAYVQIVFIASTPIATAVEDELVATMNVTTTTGNITFTVGGSYVAEPFISVVINSVTGGTGQSISLFNALNNQGITITQDFVAGDIIEIDSAQMQVLRNGGEIDFEGIFPTFSPGSQQLGYSDTFTARNVDVTVRANERIV